MRPDGTSLLLLAVIAVLVLAEMPVAGDMALIRLLLLAVTTIIVAAEQGGGSRGFFSLCAGQAVAVTASSPAAAVVLEALLLILFLRMTGAGRGEGRPILLFAGMAAAVIVLFSVTGSRIVLTGVLVAVGFFALLSFPLADYRLKRKYGRGVAHEAVQ